MNQLFFKIQRLKRTLKKERSDENDLTIKHWPAQSRSKQSLSGVQVIHLFLKLWMPHALYLHGIIPEVKKIGCRTAPIHGIRVDKSVSSGGCVCK